ncbi:MAG: 30S ribosomal protein S8 [Patescibacteria group bacterium]
MVKDNVANLIVKLRNAGTAHKASVSVASSKFTQAILALLEKEGYIKSFAKKEGAKGKEAYEIEVVLAYDESGNSKIAHTERISKLSKRTYMGSRSIRSVRSGFGMLVLSTPKGVMSDREAKKNHLGGEALFKIW